MSESLQSFYRRMRDCLQPVTRSPEQARTEAELMLEARLGIRPDEIHSNGERLLSDREILNAEELLSQRIEKRIPIQYLLHQCWFFGLKLYVNPHVLIPRPETELLVEAALAFLQPGMRVADIGTGSGAIPLALSHRLGPDITVVGTDISDKALKVARINQRMLGTHVDFRCGDMLAPLAGERFDCIISNPPYVDQDLRAVLDVEVASHEPEVALFSPTADAYHYYRHLAQGCPPCLKPGGLLLVEVGAGMAETVAGIFRAENYQFREIITDYAGIDRIVSVSR